MELRKALLGVAGHFMDYFELEAAAYGWYLTPEQLGRFARYQELLMDWSTRINLTGIREPRLIQQRHFLDSLSCAQVTGDLNGQVLVDVGSGAGFPGLPLKILFPELHLTLVESVAKKTRFLRTVISDLGLTKVNVETGRVESLGQHKAHRGQYDWAVARGVATLRVLVEYLLPLCRIGGHALAQKGKDAASEATEAINAIFQLGGSHPVLHSLQLPGRTQEQFLVVVEKVAECPDRYPRRIGIPAKRPI